jgi:hypothetical protein
MRIRKKQKSRVGRGAQVVECSLIKLEALSSSPSTRKKKRKKEK